MKMAHKYSGCVWIWILLLAVWSPIVAATDAGHPLEPPDLSSPRATLNSFLTVGDLSHEVLRQEHWTKPSRETVGRLKDLDVELQQMLDLSEIPPAARFDLGRDKINYLYEVLCRIEIPPQEEIPDAGFYAEAQEHSGAAGTPERWTIPHTEITLVRMTEGPQAGKFLFSKSTVARAGEFFEKTRRLAYRRDIPLRDYFEKRHYLSMTGWFISSQTIEKFPEWLKISIYRQAVWKWIALFGLLAITAAVILIIHRLARRGLSGHSAKVHLRHILTPLMLLLVPVVLNMANQQLTLVGAVTGIIKLLSSGITYFALAWVIWTGSMAVAETVIASPKIQDRSLNAHLLRLIARSIGIIAVIIIVLYVSNQIGAPLYGIVAGLGVGGLAVALAVRPTLENIIGGLVLFADKPVRVGDFCRFGDEEGEVEEIGLRSTRLRKRDETLVSVPNADFVQRELHNYARRRARLYQTTLGLRYETTAEQLRYVMTKLREMLYGHPKVSPGRMHVRFQGFGNYSIDIVVFAYIRTRDWLNYRAIREDINLRIMDIVRDAGTGFAFPSQTTYLGRDMGIDTEQERVAETQVQQWRSTGKLPFPEFDENVLKEMEDVLDYPPKGSPGYKPHSDSPKTPPNP